MASWKMRVLVIGYLVLGFVSVFSKLGIAALVDINMDPIYSWGRGYDANSNTWITTNPYYTAHNEVNALGYFDNGQYGLDISNPAKGSEDAFAVLRISRVTFKDSGEVWYDNATSDDEILAFFYGIHYVAAEVKNATDIWHYGTGGWVDIYRHPKSPVFNPPITDRNGKADFDGVTEGQLVLRLQARPIWDVPQGFGVSKASYLSEVSVETETMPDGNTVTRTNISSWLYFDVIGGAWADYFDTNTKKEDTDIYWFYSYSTTDPVIFSSNDWVLKNAHGNAEGDMVPEPASVMLLGFGLIGLGFIRRKR